MEVLNAVGFQRRDSKLSEASIFEVIDSRVHVPALLFHISNPFLRILVVPRSGLFWIRFPP